MLLVQRQQPGRAVPGRQDHKRGVGEPDTHLAVALDQRGGLPDVGGTEVGERVSTRGGVAEDLELVADTGSRDDRVVQLGQDERREAGQA